MRELFARFGKGLNTLIAGQFSLNTSLDTRNHGNQDDGKDQYALANECGGLAA